MFLKKVEDVYNPIIYIFSALAVSSISYGLIEYFRGLAIITAALFFLFIFYYLGIKFGAIIILFFIIGIGINTMYYGIPQNINGEVRIVKMNSYNVIGNYKGRSVILKCDNEGLQLGEIYKIQGQLKSDQDRSKGIIGEVKANKVTKLKDDFISKLYNIKKEIYDSLEKNLGKRKAAIVAAISFGYSDYLDDEDKEEMRYYGIIHSISVSGLHVITIYAFLSIILGKRLSIVAVFIYVVFTGSSYSSIRAFIMLLSVEGADFFKRNNNSIASLCISSLILLIYKPYSIFEISFHLSYLATLGIILFNKKINYSLYRLPDKIRNMLSVTLSAQVLIFPYLMLIFKNFSVNFILGNLVLIPFINMIVILGNILVIFFRISYAFDYISYLILVVIKTFEVILNRIESYSLPIFYGNDYCFFFYLFFMISWYFIKKGYKEFKYIPLISILVIAVQLYSPVLNIKYYTEGALLISYKGEEALITNKKQIDIEKLIKSSGAEKVYRNYDAIRIGKYKIKTMAKDYILDMGNKKYILKMSLNKNDYKDYDIINFKDGPMNKIYIINKQIIEVCS